MNDRTLSSAAIVVGGALMIVLLASGQGSSQEWSIRRSRMTDHVQFRVERYKPGSHWSNSNDVPLDRFRGLTEAMSHGGRAQFEYVQDAGRLVCEGRFFLGEGTGKFTFAPNPEFTA